MKKSKRVLGFITVLVMVASGFAAMSSADIITSESDAIYVPDNHMMIRNTNRLQSCCLHISPTKDSRIPSEL